MGKMVKFVCLGVHRFRDGINIGYVKLANLRKKDYPFLTLRRNQARSCNEVGRIYLVEEDEKGMYTIPKRGFEETERFYRDEKKIEEWKQASMLIDEYETYKKQRRKIDNTPEFFKALAPICEYRFHLSSSKALAFDVALLKYVKGIRRLPKKAKRK